MTIIAYRAGRGARFLKRSIYSNPYPFLAVCAEKRRAWDQGWLDQNAEIAP